MIRQRLARVADDTRSIVNLAAVAGDEVNTALLAAASGARSGLGRGASGRRLRAGIFGQRAGRTDGEIAEAVAMAAFTRDMSTLLNGMQVDEVQFRKDVEHLVKNVTTKKEHAAR